MLIELVEHDLGLDAALQLDHDAHAVTVALVADIRDIFDRLVVDQLGNALDQKSFVDLVGNFGDHDRFAIFVESLDASFGAHDEAAAAGLVGVNDSGAAMNNAGGGEVWALHEFQNVRKLGGGIVHQRNGGVHDLGEIVGRNVGGHADRNAVRAVDQQVRNPGGQDRRFLIGIVISRNKVDRVLVDIRIKIFRHAGEPAFGVPHGRRWVSVYRAKVSLAIHQRIAQREGLRHAHERVIKGSVAVGMEFTHGLADNPGALHVPAVMQQAGIVHVIENAAVHRFQSVTHIRQGAADDYRHRIVEIRLLHLLFDIDGLDVECTGDASAISAIGRRSQRKFRILIVSHIKAFSS